MTISPDPESKAFGLGKIKTQNAYIAPVEYGIHMI